MKRLLICFALLSLACPLDALAETTCYGTETLTELKENKGRFTHCETGNIISVYTTVLKEASPNPTDLNNIRAWSLRENEVEKYCAYDHPIIFLGETEMDATALIGETLRTKHRWYSCIYNGKERETVSPKAPPDL